MHCFLWFGKFVNLLQHLVQSLHYFGHTPLVWLLFNAVLLLYKFCGNSISMCPTISFQRARNANIPNHYIYGYMCVFLTSCFYLKHNVSETVFCLLFQVEPTVFGPIDRANPYVRTWKIKMNPTCIWSRPQNTLEWTEDLADSTTHDLQEIQEIRPHVPVNPAWTSLLFRLQL
jgi:hypothetical protein